MRQRKSRSDFSQFNSFNFRLRPSLILEFSPRPFNRFEKLEHKLNRSMIRANYIDLKLQIYEEIYYIVLKLLFYVSLRVSLSDKRILWCAEYHKQSIFLGQNLSEFFFWGNSCGFKKYPQQLDDIFKSNVRFAIGKNVFS